MVRSRSNVWTSSAGVNSFRAGRRWDDLSIHPTVKPVALVADAMRDCSRRGDIVLDPFIGSGTTILAASGLAGAVMVWKSIHSTSMPPSGAGKISPSATQF